MFSILSPEGWLLVTPESFILAVQNRVIIQTMKSPLYLLHRSPRMDRRSFLFATSSLAAAALWSPRAFGAVTKVPAFSDYPFQLGVASGDPASDGFVLWTRLAPKPIE